MKPVVKAPGTKRLKLQCDGSLSNFAFNFNLRRYTTVAYHGISGPPLPSPVGTDGFCSPRKGGDIY